MATNHEVQVSQKQRLFMLMKLKVRNEGMNIAGLDDMIIETKAAMTQEDVAWVEKMIKEL